MQLVVFCVRFATIHGLWPLLGGNLVALKQMKPDLTVVSIPQIRAKVCCMYVQDTHYPLAVCDFSSFLVAVVLASLYTVGSCPSSSNGVC